jgi:hypothetical protein
MPRGVRVFDSVQEFDQAVLSFFQSVDTKTQRVTLLDLAEHLDVPDRTMRHYGTKPGYGEIYERARQKIENQRNHMLFDGKIPTAGVIFDLINNYGWKQPNQIEHSGAIAVAHSHVPLDVQNELDAHRLEIEGAPADENPS